LNLQVSPETKDACDLFRILLDKRRLQYDSRGAHCISNIIIITIIVIIINTRAKAMVVAINHESCSCRVDVEDDLGDMGGPSAHASGLSEPLISVTGC
jgi:hypothetical protein